VRVTHGVMETVDDGSDAVISERLWLWAKQVWSEGGRQALSFVGVNGREERQLVEDLVNEFPETWQSEWLRYRARALKDERLAGWADYYENLREEFERSPQCARA